MELNTDDMTDAKTFIETYTRAIDNETDIVKLNKIIDDLRSIKEYSNSPGIIQFSTELLIRALEKKIKLNEKSIANASLSDDHDPINKMGDIMGGGINLSVKTLMLILAVIVVVIIVYPSVLYWIEQNVYRNVVNLVT